MKIAKWIGLFIVGVIIWSVLNSGGNNAPAELTAEQQENQIVYSDTVPYTPPTTGGGGASVGGGSSTFTPKTFSWCKQSSANVSNASDGTCTLTYSGEYNWTSTLINTANIFDNVATTYGYANISANETFHIGYIIPYDAQSDSLLQVYDGNVTISPYANYTNVTIPSVCWNINTSNNISYVFNNHAEKNLLVMKIEMTNQSAQTGANWSCFTGTGYYGMRYAFGNQSGWVYEENMYWHILS